MVEVGGEDGREGVEIVEGSDLVSVLAGARHLNIVVLLKIDTCSPLLCEKNPRISALCRCPPPVQRADLLEEVPRLGVSLRLLLLDLESTLGLLASSAATGATTDGVALRRPIVVVVGLLLVAILLLLVLVDAIAVAAVAALVLIVVAVVVVVVPSMAASATASAAAPVEGRHFIRCLKVG